MAFLPGEGDEWDQQVIGFDPAVVAHWCLATVESKVPVLSSPLPYSSYAKALEKAVSRSLHDCTGSSGHPPRGRSCSVGMCGFSECQLPLDLPVLACTSPSIACKCRLIFISSFRSIRQPSVRFINLVSAWPFLQRHPWHMAATYFYQGRVTCLRRPNFPFSVWSACKPPHPSCFTLPSRNFYGSSEERIWVTCWVNFHLLLDCFVGTNQDAAG